MARIDKGYQSFFSNFSDTKFNYQKQWMGSLQPAATLYRDFRQTFKPYRSFSQLGRDVFQILRGIGNITTGSIGLAFALSTDMVAIIFFLMISPLLIFLLFFSKTSRRGVIEVCSQTTCTFLTWTIKPLLEILQGITQVITAPFVIVTKLPLRLVLTFLTWKKQGLPLIEENPKIQALSEKLAEELATNLQDANSTNPASVKQEKIAKKLLQSYQKARSRGQLTRIRQEAILSCRVKINGYPTQSDLLAFNGLFNISKNQDENLEQGSLYKPYSALPSF